MPNQISWKSYFPSILLIVLGDVLDDGGVEAGCFGPILNNHPRQHGAPQDAADGDREEDFVRGTPDPCISPAFSYALRRVLVVAEAERSVLLGVVPEEPLYVAHHVLVPVFVYPVG